MPHPAKPNTIKAMLAGSGTVAALFTCPEKVITVGEPGSVSRWSRAREPVERQRGIVRGTEGEGIGIVERSREQVVDDIPEGEARFVDFPRNTRASDPDHLAVLVEEGVGRPVDFRIEKYQKPQGPSSVAPVVLEKLYFRLKSAASGDREVEKV